MMESTTTGPVTPHRIQQFAWGYAAPLILEAAIRNGVFNTLDQGPKTVEEVSRATGASMRGLGAILDALCGFEFLGKDAESRYSLTAESAAFLVSGKPGYMGGLIEHTSGQLIPKWLEITEIVRTGHPASTVNQEEAGSKFFEKFVADIFPMSYPAAQELGRYLRLGEARVLDLAAGSGVWGIALAESSAGVRVSAVDWPTVLAITRKMAARFGLADRFEYIPGDLLEVDFGSGYQVATLGHILHSEGEQRSRELLKKTARALKSGGTIAIAEFLVDADRKGPVGGLIFAVNMLVNTENGGTYSFEEIGEWLREAGFSDPRQLAAPGPSPLILATKR